ncbi:MAG: 5-formyltetrahydrofolate cyclo-ligase [Pseudomonadota bacterium]
MIDDAKAAMRAEAKRRRDEALWADPTPNLLAAIGETPAARIAAYLPIGSEADPLPAVAVLRARGSAILMPRIAGPGRIDFHLWDDEDPVEAAIGGVAQPLATAPRDRPDVVIAPLLAFDRTGGRLGYGGGYYDRAIAALRADGPVFVVGLAFAAQEAPKLPMGPFDARLDAIATEAGVVFIDAP